VSAQQFPSGDFNANINRLINRKVSVHVTLGRGPKVDSVLRKLPRRIQQNSALLQLALAGPLQVTFSCSIETRHTLVLTLSRLLSKPDHPSPPRPVTPTSEAASHQKEPKHWPSRQSVSPVSPLPRRGLFGRTSYRVLLKDPRPSAAPEPQRAPVALLLFWDGNPGRPGVKSCPGNFYFLSFCHHRGREVLFAFHMQIDVNNMGRSSAFVMPCLANLAGLQCSTCQHGMSLRKLTVERSNYCFRLQTN